VDFFWVANMVAESLRRSAYLFELLFGFSVVHLKIICHDMKVIYSIMSFSFLLAFFTCTIKDNPEVKNIKDLDENMLDIKMYHELVGDELRAGDLADANWFLTGMDSVLQIVSSKYDIHRKLNKPFKDSYENNLRPAITELNNQIQRQDLPAAKNAYAVLTKKCNNCHLDNDIDKVVQNWLLRGE
jgi:hypothetical protein